MNVLIIEDDLKLLRLYSRMLQADGHKVFMAATLSAAQTLLENYRFDVCLADVQVGHLNSLTYLRHLPQARHNIERLVVISGDERYRDLTNSMHGEFLTKPISRDNLLGAVRGIATQI